MLLLTLKGSNGENHCSGSHHPIKKSPQQNLTPCAICKTLLLPPMQSRSSYADLILFEHCHLAIILFLDLLSLWTR